LELPRGRAAVSDAAAPDLHVLRARVQVDVSGGVARRHSGGRDDARWRGGFAPGQLARVVPADQPDALVDVSVTAATPPKRKYGQADQLQAQADPAAGHYHSSGMRTARWRIGSSRDQSREAQHTGRIMAGHRRGGRGRFGLSEFPMRQVRHSEEA